MEQGGENVYELIGRLVVAFVRRRYRRQIRVAAATGVLVASLAAVGIYFAARDESDES